MKRGVVFASLASLIVVAAIGTAFVVFRHRTPEIVGIGGHAPDFRAVTLDSLPRTKTLADYRGHVILLNIWATWCEPCREEMPSLEKLQQTYGPQGLDIVAVSIDDSDATAVVRGFVRQYGLTFQVLHDQSGKIQDIYNTSAVPQTFVIARDGIIRKEAATAEDWSSPGNQALIAQLLHEGPHEGVDPSSGHKAT